MTEESLAAKPKPRPRSNLKAIFTARIRKKKSNDIAKKIRHIKEQLRRDYAHGQKEEPCEREGQTRESQVTAKEEDRYSEIVSVEGFISM